ncbi:Asp-tRNA(Asn)/Glu-tRNA(Gln) amidotransferase subunit GatA [Candidatus Falkowbacteria bacterium]|nr:Asp-tRNA(Asn)/Glu-tRNA(Gln) amidotransferase subunit GatA [Candidatus Falkowbacteria bacterium]NCT55122.1 Asp-tRNA(Asn)/Glu-tRNA(Gln) amidotransferase subunit GatA [Candidatus Falkowbacteria bacterium]
MELNKLTIKEARTLLDKGELKAKEITLACLKVISENNKVLNACLLVDEAGALLAAEKADERLESGEKGGLLGIPYLCKDNIMVKGLKTTAASNILENYIAPYDATIIKKLKAAGAILLGKTNLDEFAHGASTENSAYGATKNPLDLTRVPGGSSGGSAAAVAANLCLFAIGSDTGGSIRQPASFCGIFGFKPSYGRVSRHGLLSMTSSTDVIGPLTKTVYDSALVLEAISGYDELDATSVQAPVDYYLEEEKENLQNLVVGLPKEYFVEGLNPEIKARIDEAVLKLKELGAKVKEVSLPYTKYGIPVYYLITPAEISSNLARFDGIAWGFKAKESYGLQNFYKDNRGQGFGPEAKRRIILGTYALSAGYYDAYYKKAQAVRALIVEDFNQAFKKVDILLTPTSPHPAFKLGAQNADPLAMYLEDIFVTGASLAGLAAISIPAGEVSVKDGGGNLAGEKVETMPIGLQLIAPKLKENILFRTAFKI